jgi:hypothetical protein
MAGVIKPPYPYPVAFCWYWGSELSRKDVIKKGCMDSAKQIDGKCKHYQAYGRKAQAN